ncbi:MAG: hypothetical protein RR326_15445, partial [Stenotrophomonas sp.]
YSIGTRVRVQVSRVDLDGRKIDFRLVRDDLELASAASAKQKGNAGHTARSQAPRAPVSRPDDMVRARGSNGGGGSGGGSSNGDAPRSGKPAYAKEGKQEKSARGAKPANKKAGRKSASKGRKSSPRG